MFQHNFLCQNCGKHTETEFSNFIRELGALPIIWREWCLSEHLISYSSCSSCGYVFRPLFETCLGNHVTIPIILERFANQAIKGATDHTVHSQNIPPISAESIQHGLRSKGLGELLWGINEWIAVAVASGVIGNLSYDAIKNSIIKVRKNLLEQRKQLQNDSSVGDKYIDKEAKLQTVIDRIQEVKKRSITEGRSLYDIPRFDNADYPYFRWWMEYGDRVHKKRIEKRSNLTDYKIEMFISGMYEYAVKRLKELVFHNP